MDNTTITETLSTGTATNIGDLNDWAVNTVRDYARAKGFDAKALMVAEVQFIGSMDLETYRTARRAGQKYPLTRAIRRAAWAILATSRALKTLGY